VARPWGVLRPTEVNRSAPRARWPRGECASRKPLYFLDALQVGTGGRRIQFDHELRLSWETNGYHQLRRPMPGTAHSGPT